MTKRETRVINAFIDCVKNGEFTEAYAITIIEDDKRYGWLSESAKEEFYSALNNDSESETELYLETEIPVEEVENQETESQPEQESEPEKTKALWED